MTDQPWRDDSRADSTDITTAHLARPSSSAHSFSTIHTQIAPAPVGSDDGQQDEPIRAVRVEVSRKLSWWDVCALIINKMIGTGIFTGPPTVLLYTGNKRIAIVLWLVGFIYTLISMTLYLEYARKLPYTGGELVYLDEVMWGPPLLAYTVYALYFVLMYTTTTNAMHFAYQVIVAATNDETIHDERVLRLIAVIILSFICLVMYFSAATGRRLNRYSAYAKIGLMLVIVVAGGIKANQVRAADLGRSFDSPKTSAAAALLQIFFAFQGWENATLVAGEIPDNKTLRKGFISAVWIVGLLYLAINIVYCFAIPWNEDGTLDLQYVSLFFGNDTQTRLAWAILIAMSAAGSMISVIYTCARVKQTIAWCNVIPWSTFWRKTAPVRTDISIEMVEIRPFFPPAAIPTGGERRSRIGPHVLRTGTPQGGLALHWVGSVFFICISATIAKLPEALSFSGLLLSYGHAMVGVAVGFTFPRFVKKNYQVNEQRGWKPGQLPGWLTPGYMQWALGGGYAVFSLAILVLTVLPPYVNTDGSTRQLKGWIYPVIMFSVFAGSILYYLIFLCDTERTAVELAGVQLSRKTHGVDDKQILGRKCELCDDEQGPHRHSRDGYQTFVEMHSKTQDGKNPVYWFFGGPNEHHYPDLRIDSTVQACRKWSEHAWGRIRRMMQPVVARHKE